MAKIGILSFAHVHAPSYASCLTELSEAELAAVWDDNARRGRAAAKAHGARFIGDLDAFLATDIAGVVITAENVRHRELVERAAAAGKWILCEKPLATTVQDAKAMIAACKKAKVGLGTAFPCRYIPAVAAVKEQIAAGRYGDIIAGTCTNNGQFPGGWFAKELLSGGGATMDHTVHVADLLRWMLGKEFTKVYCENGRLLRTGIDTDDIGCLHLEMEGGAMISHIASWSRPGNFPTWGDVTMELIGEKGVVTVDGFKQKLNVYDEDAVKAEWAYWGDNPDLALIRDFVSAVDERREPTITGYDGLKAVEVTEAAYRSAASGRAVAVSGGKR